VEVGGDASDGEVEEGVDEVAGVGGRHVGHCTG
jgi:hypothetical protein